MRRKKRHTGFQDIHSSKDPEPRVGHKMLIAFSSTIASQGFIEMQQEWTSSQFSITSEQTGECSGYGNKVIDVGNLSAFYYVSYFYIALASFNDLPPNFGRQSYF